MRGFTLPLGRGLKREIERIGSIRSPGCAGHRRLGTPRRPGPEAMTCVARAGVIAGQKLRVQLPNAVSGRAGAYWRRVAIAVPYLGPGRPLAWLGGIELPAAAVQHAGCGTCNAGPYFKKP